MRIEKYIWHREEKQLSQIGTDKKGVGYWLAMGAHNYCQYC